MSGYPVRPGLSDFGSTLENTYPVRDPSREVAAEIFNLTHFQVAGMGLLSPRAMIVFTPGATPVALVARAEAWNPDRRTTGTGYTDPTGVRNADGDYTWTWPASVPDKDGTLIPLAFEGALGWDDETDSDPTGTLKHVRAAVVIATPNKIRVARFLAAALEQAGRVRLYVW